MNGGLQSALQKASWALVVDDDHEMANADRQRVENFIIDLSFFLGKLTFTGRKN